MVVVVGSLMVSSRWTLLVAMVTSLVGALVLTIIVSSGLLMMRMVPIIVALMGTLVVLLIASK